MAKFTCIFGSYKKYIFFFLLALTFKMQLLATGSLITIRNYYFFQEARTNSKKYYIPRYQVFDVLDIQKNEQEGYFFLVNANVIQKKKKRIGFIYASLNSAPEELVQIFTIIPKGQEILNYHKVAFAELKLTKKQIISKDFPFQIWQQVEYNLDLPERVWALENAIVYRFDQSSQWLTKKLQEILKAKIPSNKRNSILAGNIEENFSKNEVLLTLGVPKKIILKNNITHLLYQYRKIILENNKVIQIITEKE